MAERVDPGRKHSTDQGETWNTRLPSGASNPSLDNERETVGPGVGPVPPRAVRVAGYEILDELGRGGMGVVYKARQLGLDRLVALKMVLAGEHAGRDELDRFRSEAQALARLHHPNIIQIYDIDEHEGRPFFSMELVAGGSLADRMCDRPHAPADAARLVETVARAMHAAHKQGIVHRDLKPANVLLSEGLGSTSIADPSPKVTDFGIAKSMQEVRGRTRSGDILGTPSYMAPEQATGHVSQIGPATDIHALGAILYHLLVGKPPFGKDTLLDTLEQVRSQEPTPPSRLVLALPRDLEIICLKCLRKQPADRYTTAEELADDLDRYLSGEPIRARPLSRTERVVRWTKRRPLQASVLIALVFVTLTALAAARLLMSPKQYRESDVRDGAQRVRRALFERIHGGLTPEGWVRNDLGRADNSEHEPWSHAQSICAMLNCPEATPEELREVVRGLEVLRTGVKRIERDGVRYGWFPRSGWDHTQCEPFFWTAAALVEALRRPDVVEEEQRGKFEDFLAETHAVLRTYASTEADGGWNMVPNPRDPRVQNTYVNVLALQTLLDTRRAGMAWDGSTRKRDELIERTARRLLSAFDADNSPPGWHKDNGSRDRIIDGLTLQAYAVLLRASNEAGLELPTDVVARCKDHLIECGTRTFAAADQAAYVSYPYRRFDGREETIRSNFSYLWYPWAVHGCVSWLDHARRHDLPAKDVAKVRAALGHLIVDLGDEAVHRGEAFVYIPAERLYALGSVPR